MWSKSVEVLNPWDALCEHRQKIIDSDIVQSPTKRTIKGFIADFLRNIADMLDP